MLVQKLLSCLTCSDLQGSHWITGYGKLYFPQSPDIISSLHTLTGLFLLVTTLTLEPCVLICDCVLQFCDGARTLCAGTRLTNTVSNSSCETVSPSQMMELIRSTICMCTFWLWPLLGKRGRRGQSSTMECLYNLIYNIDHWFLLR